MAVTNSDRKHQRWLHRLAVVADLALSDRLRLAAIRAIQASLPEINPLKHIKPVALLGRVLYPWDERPYLSKYGRYEDRPVSRPPTAIADLW
jgi:hypothetical protein